MQLRTNPKGEKKTRDQGHAHWLLQCPVATVCPIQVKELAAVLAFDFNTEGLAARVQADQ